ncbi:hypothetical protein Anapl_09347 [Anas platyrhynchos]|uniref:Uncharacterized protein n=1 Tax=Anas platyrhynchos TaxID=8839 RepID=R0M5Q0_ANAPL|nr:hypothetical protein Anapl_09347 [Anas platyrhynchos]
MRLPGVWIQHMELGLWGGCVASGAEQHLGKGLWATQGSCGHSEEMLQMLRVVVGTWTRGVRQHRHAVLSTHRDGRTGTFWSGSPALIHALLALIELLPIPGAVWRLGKLGELRASAQLHQSEGSHHFVKACPEQDYCSTAPANSFGLIMVAAPREQPDPCANTAARLSFVCLRHPRVLSARHVLCAQGVPASSVLESPGSCWYPLAGGEEEDERKGAGGALAGGQSSAGGSFALPEGGRELVPRSPRLAGKPLAY